MCGSLITKDVKKPYSSRQEGGVETQSWGTDAVGREAVVGVEEAVPHSRVVDKNQEGHLGSERSQPPDRPHSPGFQHQEDKPPLLLAVKTVGIGALEETDGLSVKSTERACKD